MKIKNNKRRNKQTLLKAVIIIFFILAFTGVTVISIYKNNEVNNNYKRIELEIENKEQTINQLVEEIEELRDKQKNLENTVEEIKIAKTATKKSSSSSVTKKYDTVLASAAISTTDKWIWANVSAYCACMKCCGKTNGITASGTKATAGKTIAASSAYKFGTQIEIEGMGVYTVEDRGGAITGNKIDVYFDTHQEALNFGRRQLQIRVIT